MAEFDTIAENYRELVDQNVRVTGESSDYFAAYKAEYIARRVAPRGAGKLLDYGCGVGLLSRHLKSCLVELRIDGFDVSRGSLDRVDEGLLGQGIFTSNLNELGKDYDVVVLANVLHHVKPKDRQALLGEAISRLADDGKLVVFEHNPINPLTRWAVSQCPFDGDAVLLPKQETQSHLRSCELHILRREYVVFFPRWLALLRPLEPSLSWCPLGAQYAVVAARRPR